ncbi:basic salivary proline-rich protein 2-like [Balaenoptera ricei]|uniref:basic salivary proline-rich protein 2-like n=1 Tax=Balaenoptera ricei TaxID=2746895 RepID=UPI0028BF0E01|nr:basic salivary proline-rich protein 2-like [Balaenoptera ricei]
MHPPGTRSIPEGPAASLGAVPQGTTPLHPRPQEGPPPSPSRRAAPPPAPGLAPAALGSAWARLGPDKHEVSSRSPGPEGENAERWAQRAPALGKPGPGRRQGGALGGPPEGQLRAAAGARRAREARGRLTHLPSRRRNPCDSGSNSAHIQIPAPESGEKCRLWGQTNGGDLGKSSSPAPETLLKGPAFEQRQEGTHEAMTEDHLGR